MNATTETPATELDIIDAYADAGLAPTDEAPVEWLNRWDAWARFDGGFIVAIATDEDTDLRLYVLTKSGVIRSEARFDATDLGRIMFVAAVEGLFR